MTLFGFDLWMAAVVFARMGAVISLLPGFGEPAVPAQLRLAVALTISVMLVPLIGPTLPAMPADFGDGAGVIITEVLIGLFFGAIARILMTSLATTGQIIGLETGLSFAQTADPTMTQAGQVIGVFLGLLGVALIFATDVHHLFLVGVVESYQVFKPGIVPNLGDAADAAVSAVAQSFLIGMQIAAPLLLAGIVFRLGLGVLSRLIPQIQVFFVAMPINVIGGLLITMLGLSAGVLIWLDSLKTFATQFGQG